MDVDEDAVTGAGGGDGFGEGGGERGAVADLVRGLEAEGAGHRGQVRTALNLSQRPPDRPERPSIGELE